MKNESMGAVPTIDEVKHIVLPILQRHKAKRAGLFGSLVRGDLKKSSDIDILVELDGKLSLLDVIGIQQELEDALGRSVDLVEYVAIKPRIKKQILDQEVPIL
jgi:predicted nucleotidyltransferase